MNKKSIEIDYKKIKQNYYSQLTSKLRDFGDDNLQFWVPEDDIILSLGNLLFSLAENNYENCEIHLEKAELNEDLIQKINDNFSNFSKIEIKLDQKYTLYLKDLNKINLNYFLDNYFLDSKDKKTSSLKKNQIKQNKIIENINDKIKDFYKISYKEFKFRIEKKEFENLINKFDYHSKLKNFGLAIKVKNKIITEVKFYGDGETHNINLLEKFCEQILNKPIFEAYEHGVIYLEYIIRDEKIYSKLNGVVTGVVLSETFEIPKKLINNIWGKYKEHNIIESKNYYDLLPSEHWVKLSTKTKIDKINSCLNEFEKINKIKNQLKFSELNKDNIRITIEFLTNENDIIKAKLLLNFEKYLRNKLDKRLEIFYKELKDINKLRIKNLK